MEGSSSDQLGKEMDGEEEEGEGEPRENQENHETDMMSNDSEAEMRLLK